MLRWSQDQTFSFDHTQLKADTSQTIKREKKALKKKEERREEKKRETQLGCDAPRGRKTMTDTPATTATPKTATITMANMMTTTLASPEKSVLKRDYG